MKDPVLPVAAALAAGIYVERWLWLSEREYVLAASVLLLLAVVTLRLGSRAGAVAFALIGSACCGALFLFHWQNHRAADDLENLVRAGRVELNEPVRVAGWIAGEEFRRSDEIYLLRLDRVESAQHVLRASGTVRLQHFRWSPSEPRIGLHYGDRVEALVRLRQVRGFRNPGGFDREARARREGTVYYASVKAAELAERLPGRRGNWLSGRVLALRATLLERLDRLFPPASASNALLRAMLLGERSALDERVGEDFRKTGTYHALVVSGLHTGAIAGFLLLLLTRLRVAPLPATFAAMAGVALFVLLTGATIPTVRSGAMFCAYLVARLVYRERALLNAIAVAALLLLVFDPADLNDAGFQLSFFSVLLIAAIAAPWIDSTSAPYRRALTDLDNVDREMSLAPRQAQFRIEMRMFRDALAERIPGWAFLLGARTAFRVWELIAVALVLQLGFLLPMAIYFHRAGWVSIGANLFIVPLLGLTVPLGVAMLAVSLVSPSLAGLLAIPLAALVETMMAVARWHAGFRLASFRVPVPPLWLSAGFVGVIVVLAACLLAGRRRAALASGCLLAVAAVLITWHPFAPHFVPGQLEVTALDVGQGDALVVLVPPGRVLVEDCGGLPGQLGTNTGEEIVSAYLWSRGIQRIDVLAVTHAHQDHVGGFEAVLANFPVGEVWLPPSRDSDAYQPVIQKASEMHIPVRMWTRGQSAALGGAAIDFLSPGTEYQAGRRAQNNDSLVMRLRYGARSVLLPGDIERKMEMQIVEEGYAQPCDWLKVPHHGSKTSNSIELLERLHAPYGVISVAENSPFGHPHQEALDRLAQAGVRVFRTDRDGAVTWRTDGRRIEIQTYQWERPRAAMDLW